MFLVLWLLVLGAVGTVSACENSNKEPVPSDWRADVPTPYEQFLISLHDEGVIQRISQVCSLSYNHPLCDKILKEIQNCSILELIETCKKMFEDNPSDITRCERLKPRKRS